MDSVRRKAIHDAMVRLSDGDRTAFPLLVDMLWPVILAFAQRGVRQDADAEDVAQEVFLRICSRIADFDRSRDGLSWAFGIAGYEVMTHRRRVLRRRELHGEALLKEVAHSASLQDQSMLAREIEAALEAALGELSDEDRRSLVSLDSETANEAMGATQRKRKQRALARLRDLWRSIHGEP